MKDSATPLVHTVPASVPALPPGVVPVADRIRGAVLEVGGSLAAVIDALPQPVRRAADLERALGLQTPLAWRVFRLSQAPDAASAVEYLPTVKQLERVVEKAAATAGIPSPLAERARVAVGQFAAMVEEVGGDQRGFESLVSGLSPAGVRRVEIEHRRWAFRGNTHLWGLQCRTLIACAIERPGQDGRSREGLTVRGFLDLQTLRPEVPLTLEARFRSADTKVAEPGVSLSPLELVTEFSGPRLPEVRTVQAEDGWQHTQARVPGVGRTEAVSFYLHQTYQGAPEDERPGLGMLVEIPAQFLCLEYLVPEGWTDPSAARAAGFANRHDLKRAYECADPDRIPLHEQVQHFAARRDVPAASEIPRWPQLMHRVLKEQGWWGMKFDVYRCIIPFPMLHAWSGIFCQLSQSGGERQVEGVP